MGRQPFSYGEALLFRVFEISKDVYRWTVKRDMGLERHAVVISRWLWPWRESKLIILVGCLAVLDYISTYAFLTISPNNNVNVYESGLIASWALQKDGFRGLLLVDIFAVITVFAVAISARLIYVKSGFAGFGRAAFVVMLTPYVIVTMAVIVNNIVLMFL
ncbi:hypothetical protein ACFLVU_04850 [Chloroflexota bacterium]